MNTLYTKQYSKSAFVIESAKREENDSAEDQVINRSILWTKRQVINNIPPRFKAGYNNKLYGPC